MGGDEDFEADRFLPLTAGGRNVSSALTMGASAAAAAGSAAGAAALRVERPAMLKMVDFSVTGGGDGEGRTSGEGKWAGQRWSDFSPPSNWSSLAYIGFVFQHVTTKTLFDRGSALLLSTLGKEPCCTCSIDSWYGAYNVLFDESLIKP